MSKHYKRVLTIAGSDPSGGAGIQADIKTISACRCYAMSAITAIVDENTFEVKGVHPVPASFVKGQIESVLNDIGADAVKIGMLHSSELILAVKETLSKYKIRNIVLDPVMVATAGNDLLKQEAVRILQDELIPLTRVITPNIPEAEVLSGQKISSKEDMFRVIKGLSCNGKVSVLLKAGHLSDNELTDIFYNAEVDEIIELSAQRITSRNTHGTGCTLSSALSSYLAHGLSLNDAVRKAKDYINQAILHGAHYEVGKGHGPVHHFFDFWE
ncbi:bifunctional hydroxymethylpyrimidine kinase/phosphomethylpyrimidine kinase [uncultured Bacteroides sp.]|uniref:bifunctional hydroxymethylpyrimidine kinase/phosphomethylpyrimidine kinase n=1 Tax=uncultured Bacteroides sp. TaxID=162156 RepID=UPI002AAAA804|nr:bifunctional hydroxymethylpyrimidine kinase/phosphomethylpyrimidine kinase [uncultured Bacteroides sp.]